MRALSVLGLLLFVFTPAPASDLSASYGQVGVSPAVAASIVRASLSQLCGGGWGGNQIGHAPCHACRGTMPLLPSAPCVAQSAFGRILPAVYAVALQEPFHRPFALPPPSRGPPLA